MSGRRVDGNQSEIVRELRTVSGLKVTITSHIGKGFPDIVVGWQGYNWFFEIKDPAQKPSKRRLSDDEAAWHASWQEAGQVHVVLTAQEIFGILEEYTGVRPCPTHHQKPGLSTRATSPTLSPPATDATR